MELKDISSCKVVMEINLEGRKSKLEIELTNEEVDKLLKILEES